MGEIADVGTGGEPHVRPLDGAGRELDAVYRELLEPSFRADELDPLEEVREAVASGDTTGWVAVDPDGRPLAAALGEWDPELRVGLLAWVAVRPGLRGHGAGGRVLDAALRAWRAAWDPCLILAEVADPAHHAAGEAAHGDPTARLRFYLRRGARALDVPYFQPALGAGRRRVDGMLLLVLHAHPDLGGARPDTVDGAVLRAYLESYQTSAEGAVATDERARRLWRAVDRPGGVPFRDDLGDLGGPTPPAP
ncbi:GNAT family N-acetyltransferase [Streptomyces sp. 4N509B]|uniref:GNAT family N-acetyltransferase n=1 Tax=Streptomyces sp. 4N509B TaxID=3457413 RepID=UPI003FD39FE7